MWPGADFHLAISPCYQALSAHALTVLGLVVAWRQPMKSRTLAACFVVMVGFAVSMEFTTGKIEGRIAVLGRVHHPVLYWVVMSFQIVVLLVSLGVFLYAAVTRR